MALTYSTACEEEAYSRDAAALAEAADCSFNPDVEGAEEEAARCLLRTRGSEDGVWFGWWGDFRIGLVFEGTEAEALERIRELDDRPMG